MDRRTFLEGGISGLVAGCLPCSLIRLSQPDLIRAALDLEEQAISSLMSMCGYAVGAGEPLLLKRVEVPLAYYERAIAIHRKARLCGPEDALVYEFLAGAEMEAASLEALLGRDPRQHLEAAHAAVRDWQRISPGDPLPTAVLAQNRERADRIIAARTRTTVSSLFPDAVSRWWKAVA